MRNIEDLEDIKQSINFLSTDVERVVKQQEILINLVDQIKELKNLVKETDKTIHFLEHRVDDVEQQTRMEDVIIIGLKTKHRSYTRATETGGGANSGGDEFVVLPGGRTTNSKLQVVEFNMNKKQTIHSINIAACYTLPRKNIGSVPAIVVKLVNRKHKTELLRQSRQLKGSGVYLN